MKQKQWLTFDESQYKKENKELNNLSTFLEFGGSYKKDSDEGGEKEIGNKIIS